MSDELDELERMVREKLGVPKRSGRGHFSPESASRIGKRANMKSIESRRAKRVPVTLPTIGKGKGE